VIDPPWIGFWAWAIGIKKVIVKNIEPIKNNFLISPSSSIPYTPLLVKGGSLVISFLRYYLIKFYLSNLMGG
jgi:hypothetical protein